MGHSPNQRQTQQKVALGTHVVCPVKSSNEISQLHLCLMPYRTIIWSLSPWPILTNSLVIVTPSDLVKYVIFPQWYLKIPATGLHKFNLFATILFDIIWRFRHQTIFVEHIPNPTKVAKRIIKKKRIILTTCQLCPYWYHISTLNLCRCPLHLGWVKVNFNVTILPHASITATGLPSLLLGARIILGMLCLPTQISSPVPPIDSILGEAYIASFSSNKTHCPLQIPKWSKEI